MKSINLYLYLLRALIVDFRLFFSTVISFLTKSSQFSIITTFSMKHVLVLIDPLTHEPFKS